jgi:hypothetical protein
MLKKFECEKRKKNNLLGPSNKNKEISFKCIISTGFFNP